MAEIKTKATEDIVDELLEYKTVLWGKNIISYDSYHYKTERSTQEGDWPLDGFAPRKQDLTVYIMTGINKYEELIKKIGKVKISKGSCLYINSLKDIDIEVLKEFNVKSLEDMKG